MPFQNLFGYVNEVIQERLTRKTFQSVHCINLLHSNPYLVKR
jgi:hypothetical protein